VRGPISHKRRAPAFVTSLAMAVVLCLGACGGGDDTEATATDTQSATADTEATTTPPVTTNGASGAAGGTLDPASVEKALKPAFEGIVSGAELDCPDEATGEIECAVSGGELTAPGGGTIIQPGGGVSGVSGKITATLKGGKLHYKSDLSGGVSISGSVPYNP
jgi:hypothetical protein